MLHLLIFATENSENTIYISLISVDLCVLCGFFSFLFEFCSVILIFDI